MKYKSICLLLALALTGATQARVKIGTILVTGSNAHYLNFVRHMTVPFASQNGATWDAGNNTQGKTAAEIQVIVTAIKALETDPIQKEIYTRMSGTPIEWFPFTDVSHAKNNVKQRLKTLSMMATFNSSNVYDYGYPNKKPPIPFSTTATHWELGPVAGKFLFRQKADTAYNAITQLCDATTVTKGECIGAAMACVWWGASQGMGEAAFNQLYPGSGALDMDFKSVGNTSPRKNILEGLDAGEEHHVPGDWMYLRNHNYKEVINSQEFTKLIQKKSLTLNYSGENAFYFSGGKYEGLGLKLRSSADMKEAMRLGYNKDLGIAFGKTVNGTLIEEIMEGSDADGKIIWINVKRVKH